MAQAIRHHLKVGPEGELRLRDARMTEGDVVEVIVLLPERSNNPQERLEAVKRFRESFALTQSAANQWVANVRNERQSNGGVSE